MTLTIFGRIPAGQDVAAGSYSDSVVVTISFEPTGPLSRMVNGRWARVLLSHSGAR